MATNYITRETKLGAVEFGAGGLKRAVCRFDALTVRGKPYKGYMHFADYGNGLEPSREHADRPHTAYHALSVHRADIFLEDASKAARQTIWDVLTIEVKVFYELNRTEFVAAERNNALSEVTACVETVMQAERDLTKAQNALKEAKAYLLSVKKL